MKKMMNVFVVILLVIMIAGCSKNNEHELIVTIETFNRSDSEGINDKYIPLQKEEIITTYEEYLTYLTYSEDDSDNDYLSDEYFDENILFLISGYSEKEPNFKIDNYFLEDDVLHISIIEEYAFLRDAVEDYLQDYYTIELKINKRQIHSVEYEIHTDKPDYQFYSFISYDPKESYQSNNFDIIDNIEDYYNYVESIGFLKYDNDYVNDLFDTNDFDDQILIIARHDSQGNNYTQLHDLFVVEANDKQYLQIELYFVGMSGAIHYQPYVFSFVLVDSDLITMDSLEVDVTYLNRH